MMSALRVTVESNRDLASVHFDPIRTLGVTQDSPLREHDFSERSFPRWKVCSQPVQVPPDQI